MPATKPAPHTVRHPHATRARAGFGPDHSGTSYYPEYREPMSAQHLEASLPPVPNTVAGIRALLPAALRNDFDNELIAAVDQEDLGAIRAFRKRWWVRAAFESDPSLRDIPEEPLHASPIPR